MMKRESFKVYGRSPDDAAEAEIRRQALDAAARAMTASGQNSAPADTATNVLAMARRFEAYLRGKS